MRFLLLAALCLSLVSSLSAADRPNVVWIVSEDNSIHYLKHYFPGGAEAPAIEALAAHGLTFDHAFSNAPVCSVARTTLATGCYGPRIGTQYHRRYKEAAMPEGLQMFPAYLREAGYYTTNNAKKDYNATEGKGVWDESSRTASWRDRPDPKQPFFHFQSHTESHESSLQFNRASYEKDPTSHDPAAVELAPCHPDTPLFRYTHARYLDNMQKIDRIVADTVAKLEQDGLLEDTFIFYFGDHGGVLPRGKGYAYGPGLHVPLVVRIPKNFTHLAEGAALGSRASGFVSFIDFGPTVMRLAGLEVPPPMDGRPFLGQGVPLNEVNQRDTTFGHADRMDEKYDLVRTVRKGRYQYMRSYQPWLPDGLNNNYRYRMLAYQEWRDLFEAGKLEGPSRAFFEPKPVEALFDCETDPWQARNLAADPAHAETLKELRGLLGEWQRSMPDLSFYPESHLVARAMADPVSFGQQQRHEILQMADTADLALLSFAEAEPALRRALEDANPMIRYWAAMCCTAFGETAASLADAARPLLSDESPVTRLRAIEFLGLIGAVEPQPLLVELVNTTTEPVLATEALNSVVWFRDFFGGIHPVKHSDFTPGSLAADQDRRLNYLAGTPYAEEAPGARKGKKKGK